MRIVADTNVLISATFWVGEARRIMHEVQNGQITLLISAELLDEFSNVLNYSDIQQKMERKSLEMQLSVEKVLTLAEIVIPDQKLDVVKSDPKDNKVVECAKAGNADFIISYDKHLLSLVEFEGIRILAPSEFLRLLSKS